MYSNYETRNHQLFYKYKCIEQKFKIEILLNTLLILERNQHKNTITKV